VLLEAAALKQWSLQVQAQSLEILISDAPLELEVNCHSTQRKVFNSFPGNGTRNFSTRSHPLIAERVSLVPIRVLCHGLVLRWSNGHRLKMV
jgi:hypothetical protein